jgi:hypothetical protein
MPSSVSSYIYDPSDGAAVDSVYERSLNSDSES